MRDEQSGHIRAGDDEQEGHGAGQCLQHLAGLADERVARRLNRDVPLLVRRRIFTLQRRGNRVQLARAGRHRYAVAQPRHREQRMARTVFAIGLRHRQRHPDALRRVWEHEPRRQDADDRVRYVVEDQPASKYIGAAISRRPQRVAQQRDRRTPRLKLVVAKQTANRGRDADGRRKTSGNRGDADLLGLAVGGQILAAGVDRCKRGKAARAILPFEKGAGRHRYVRRTERQIRFVHHDELAGAGVWQRREQHRVHNGEQRRAGGDSERQHRAGERRQGQRAAQYANRIPHVLNELLERHPGPLIAPGLLRAVQAAELPLRPNPRGGGIQAARLEVA